LYNIKFTKYYILPANILLANSRLVKIILLDLILQHIGKGTDGDVHLNSQGFVACKRCHSPFI